MSQYLAQLSPDHEGRYSDLADPDVIATLLEAAQRGLNQTSSCQAAGISTDTYQRWMKHGDTYPDSPQASFAAAIKRARARGQMKLLERLEKHGEKQWLPNAWLLERTDQAQFALQHKDDNGPRVVVQIGIKDSDVQVTLTTPETLSPSTFASFAPSQGAGSD